MRRVPVKINLPCTRKSLAPAWIAQNDQSKFVEETRKLLRSVRFVSWYGIELGESPVEYCHELCPRSKSRIYGNRPLLLTSSPALRRGIPTALTRKSRESLRWVPASPSGPTAPALHR